MKRISYFSAIAAILLFASCTRQASTPSGSNGNNSNSTTITGSFSITRLTDNSSSEDRTADFAGYSFQFTTDGKVIATKGSFREEGTYSEKPSHEGEGAKLTINFSSQAFNTLSKNWLVVIISATGIDLKDDDPASNESLHFSAL